MKKLSIILVLGFFLSALIAPPVWAASMASQALSDGGVRFYQQGRYEEALGEFRKALLIEPDYQPALQYIKKIEEELALKNKKIPVLKSRPKPVAIQEEVSETAVSTKVVYPKTKLQKAEDIISPLVQPPQAPAGGTKPVSRKTRISGFLPTVEVVYPKVKPSAHAGAIAEALDLLEFEMEMIAQLQGYGAEGAEGAAAVPLVLILDESLKDIIQPIEIEQGKSITVRGRNIQRFLLTQPEVLTAERVNNDEILITAKEIGYTYLHAWDDNGRWTVEFLTVYPKPEGPTYAETLRREEEGARSFKLKYEVIWNSLETGRRLNSLNRSSYSWSHRLELNGETPYGDFGSAIDVRSLKTTADLSYVNMQLLNGKYGAFKGFTLQGFDYAAPVSNLAISGVSLRGAMLASPAFNNKIDYAAFWGREGGGRYGNLSPGLTKIQNSFVNGFNLNYLPSNVQNYHFTVVHGWGRDRDADFRPYAYDFTGSWVVAKNLGFDYDLAYDTKRFAHLFSTHYGAPRFTLSSELRNIDRDFYSITGKGWRAGEIGGNINLGYQATDKLNMATFLDVYQDRLFPAPDEDERLNETLNWNTSYKIDPLTNLNLDYNLQNHLGGISQYRYQVAHLGLSHKFELSRNVYASINYYHQDNKNYSSPVSSYLNEKLSLGANFNIIGNLRYYVNQEFNWLDERESGTRGRPQALETGVDWSGQILNTRPLYGNFHFSYRDEENADTPLSFMSGEDYIDGYAELSYKASDNKEIYGSANVRNIWADKEGVTKRIDATFNAGMRYVWDTGVRWESVGNVQGCVFKDLNSDGLRQRDEAPVAGVRVWLGKDKYETTDTFGYYRFKNIRARKAYITLDTSTLPQGFVVTVPVTQEVAVTHHKTSQIDFGIISRTEISGLVFEDTNGNGEYDRDDKGVMGILLTLEDGSQAETDNTGRYTFSHVATGGHTITLSLDSIPVYYLPETALAKKVNIYEGVSYLHNIPLKRVQD